MAGEQPPSWRPPSTNYTFYGGEGDGKLRIGEVYGLRAFRVTPDGWLTGITYPAPWSPDVTTAECWYVTGWKSGNVVGDPWIRPYKVNLSKDPLDPEYVWRMANADGSLTEVTEQPVPVYGGRDEPDHNLAACKCGLHGFLEGSLDYSRGGDRVSGVVRAWGKVALGPRGFRAQYARIVGLYMPDEEGDVDAGGRFRRPTYGQWTAWGWTRDYTAMPSEDVLDRVRERYGALPVFRSLDELLERFPTTEPPKTEEEEA